MQGNIAQQILRPNTKQIICSSEGKKKREATIKDYINLEVT